jgi:hypothetical protein
MALHYFDPRTVTQPSDYISGIEVLYDGGADGFSLALLKCEGVEHIAIRWNVARKEQDDLLKMEGKEKCLGTPSAKGAPSWFILPRELFQPELFDPGSPIATQVFGRMNQTAL